MQKACQIRNTLQKADSYYHGKGHNKNFLYQKQFPSCHHHKNSTASDYIYRAGLGVLYYQCQMLLYHKKYVGFILFLSLVAVSKIKAQD